MVERREGDAEVRASRRAASRHPPAPAFGWARHAHTPPSLLTHTHSPTAHDSPVVAAQQTRGRAATDVARGRGGRGVGGHAVVVRAVAEVGAEERWRGGG